MNVIPIIRPFLGAEEAAAASEAIASGWVAQGPRVAEFERNFAARVGATQAIAVSSCTTGLHLAMHLLGLGAGDEVVVPSLSFIATQNAVRYVGATPVFCDVEETTQNISAATVEPCLTPATRAVMVVHQGGIPADVQAIHALCDPLGIAVVEDAACAIGSTIDGQLVGSHSDLVVFSFHPRKVLTTGEGGMITTSRDDWAERLRRLREHGMSVSAAARHGAKSPVIEQYLEMGFNFRMTDIQAAVGLVQLSKLDVIIARRRELAARYRELLGEIPGLTMAQDPPYGTTNYQSFWVVLPDDFPVGRDGLLQTMMDNQISPRRGIMASHLEPAYAGHPHRPLPVTERLTRQSVILPLFHTMTEDDQDRVVGVLADAASVATPA